jgi:DNA-binding phage protein
MTLYEAIIKKFGSVDNIYRKEKSFNISRSNLYRIINKEIDPKVKSLEEIANLLELELLDVINMVLNNEDKLE